MQTCQTVFCKHRFGKVAYAQLKGTTADVANQYAADHIGTCDRTREPAIADALDGAAACDPPRQEDTAAQPVVHNQAVHIPSVHLPTAHAVDGNAAVDAVQVDVNTAQELVVQKEASLAADSSMVYHTAGQVGHTDASNLIGSVLCCHTVLHTLVLWA